MKIIVSSLFVLAIGVAAQAQPPASAQAPTETYAQHLVTWSLACHPELKSLTFHVTPPGTATNIIVAANVAPLGKAADADDLQVIKTQKAVVEVARSGDALAVELPLLDASRRVIGALGIHLAYCADAQRSELEAQAVKIRDELARRISHVANLLEPARADVRVPFNTRAPYLSVRKRVFVLRAVTGHFNFNRT